MKRRLLFLLLSLFPLCLFESCHMDELEYRGPSGKSSEVYGGFGIREARDYFSSNATDLAVPRIGGGVRVKSFSQEEMELIPVWEDAVQSGHSAVSVVEIPLQSYSESLSVERRVVDGKSVSVSTSLVHRRLVIARHDSCVTDMFIITVVPSMDYGGDVEKSLENFRYLGGGDFTGSVFCTTLEGDFVKAFGYRNGRQMGRLNVIPKSRMSEVLEVHPELFANYRRYSFINRPLAVTRSYVSSNESGGAVQCQHGRDIETCPDCNSTIDGGDLDEVIVPGCPYCQQDAGLCLCFRCPYCEKKLGACTCIYCPRCQKHVRDCNCFEYPDPEEPDPDPVNPGEGGGTGEQDGNEGDAPVLGNVDLMNENYFVEYKTYNDCMKVCRAIMDNYEVEPGSSANVYQLLFERNGKLGYYDVSNYKTVYKNAIDCINRHLDADRPIIVGVNHTPNRKINEGATDHWIVVVGRGYDTTKRQYYYTYMDSGRNNIDGGCNTEKNRLYYDRNSYTFVDEGASVNDSKRYDVTQVRPNDGRKLEETIAQPARP